MALGVPDLLVDLVDSMPGRLTSVESIARTTCAVAGRVDLLLEMQCVGNHRQHRRNSQNLKARACILLSSQGGAPFFKVIKKRTIRMPVQFFVVDLR